MMLGWLLLAATIACVLLFLAGVVAMAQLAEDERHEKASR